jgi:putative membrane protein
MAVFREIKPGPPPPEPDIHRIPRAVLIVINGFLVLVALAAMVGIWFGKTGG